MPQVGRAGLRKWLWNGSRTPAVPTPNISPNPGTIRKRLSARPWTGRVRQRETANVAVLWHTTMLRGFSTNYWLTFHQAKTRDGHVRKGEKATYVVFY